VPMYPRHPTVMAQQAMSLNELSGGRFRLGIGVSHRPNIEGALGMHMGSPLEFAREYIEVLRQAFSGKIDHRGQHWTIQWAYALPPTPAPIILAGLNAAMFELAGEIA